MKSILDNIRPGMSLSGKIKDLKKTESNLDEEYHGQVNRNNQYHGFGRLINHDGLKEGIFVKNELVYGRYIDVWADELSVGPFKLN